MSQKGYSKGGANVGESGFTVPGGGRTGFLCIYCTLANGCAALARQIRECTKIVNIGGVNQAVQRD